MGGNSDWKGGKHVLDLAPKYRYRVLFHFLQVLPFSFSVILLLLFLIPEESTLLTLASYEYGFLQTLALEENENSPSQGFREKYNGLGFV